MLRIYSNYTQDLIEQFGAVVSSNGRNKVKIEEVQDHLLIPEYPHTSVEGILHFIHLARSPLPTPGSENVTKEIFEMFTQLTSEVSSLYLLHKLN